MAKITHKLYRSSIKGYPKIKAVIIERSNKPNNKYTTASLARKKKKRRGIFRKSEE